LGASSASGRKQKGTPQKGEETMTLKLDTQKGELNNIINGLPIAILVLGAILELTFYFAVIQDIYVLLAGLYSAFFSISLMVSRGVQKTATLNVKDHDYVLKEIKKMLEKEQFRK
jgi:hypothetical protein